MISRLYLLAKGLVTRCALLGREITAKECRTKSLIVIVLLRSKTCAISSLSFFGFEVCQGSSETVIFFVSRDESPASDHSTLHRCNAH
jgi:hypothetical protein